MKPLYFNENLSDLLSKETSGKSKGSAGISVMKVIPLVGLCILILFAATVVQAQAQSQEINPKIPTKWLYNESTGNYQINLQRFRLEKDIVFEAKGGSGDAVFIDNQMVYYFSREDSLVWNREQILDWFGQKNEIELTVVTKEGGRKLTCKFGQEKEAEYHPISIQDVPDKSMDRTVYGMMLLGILFFITLIRFLFPAFFVFVFTSFRSSVQNEGTADFNVGAIFISLTISSAILALIYVNGMETFTWFGLLLAFGAVLGFIFLKFILNQFMIFMMERTELFTRFYVDWLFNIFRMSFVLIILYIFMGLLAVDVSWFYVSAPLVIVIFPTLVTLYSGIKSINLLPVNYLFLYLCALEILPTLVLAKAL